MSQTTSLAALRQEIQPAPNVAMSMETVAGFESMQRIAGLFSKSSIVPRAYQGNVADCFIAVDMAMRMGANPLMVMQNLYIVHGSPAWSAQFLIATFNKCGRFSAIRYEFQGAEGNDDWGCRAVTMELATKEKLAGPLVTIGLAKKEDWYAKPGSKWQTMPEQMLRYRAAAWLVRAYAPEIAMGLHTAEEVRDAVITVEADRGGVYEMTMADLAAEPPQAEAPAEEKPRRASRKKAAPETAPASSGAGTMQDDDRPPVETETAETAPPVQPAPQAERTIECPRLDASGNPRLVDYDEDCFYCREREGCPALE